MIECMVVDADFCIKLGGSEKHTLLLDILPAIAKKVFIHHDAFQEVRYPASAVSQLHELIHTNSITVVSRASLTPLEQRVYRTAHQALSAVMGDPRHPNKNQGEISSLAWAKTKGIPIFATDERNLQPIIDAVLNVGMDDIHCLRIEDLVCMARDGSIDVQRKTAKLLWVIAGKSKDHFDRCIWPLA